MPNGIRPRPRDDLDLIGPKVTVEPRPRDDLDVMRPDQLVLFDLINEARAHPENYPPNGNSSGASLSACPSPLRYSQQLSDIASHHNNFLASRDINWVNADDHMHRGPDGKLTSEVGQPMDRAGYHTSRGENVATGFPTAAEVLHFWMQDDERWKWGHRNLILNCSAQEAAIAHLQGGPGRHYWTLDLGTK
jgi:hypothetical protein